MPNTAIVWFRRDLRLTDNPAIDRAAAVADRLVAVYVQAPSEDEPWPAGGASRWWLHHSLASLAEELESRGSRLLVTAGDSLAELRRIAAASGATHVFWNRLYEPLAVARDSRIKLALRQDGRRCESFNAALLFEPWEVTTGAGGSYRVFSAFWRNLSARLPGGDPLAAPRRLPPAPSGLGGARLCDLGLLPSIPWDSGLAELWSPGERKAMKQARRFFAGSLADYAQQRDVPSAFGTSRLSPHLHFGEIGPRQLLRLVAEHAGTLLDGPAEVFARELGWREFAYHLLYHFPRTPEEPLDERFGDFPWRSANASTLLSAWQRARTGIPLVDAGMRELWHTGWMHNRVRMVVASFLTKNLRLPWQEGTRWFWDTLVDADLASNTLGWQWTAGCGADAAPYFRVFNPVRQGERFDPRGDYVRRWCPELGRLPAQHIHQPWAAPEEVLSAAGISLGQDYPRPIVDLAESRREALAAWEEIKARRDPLPVTSSSDIAP